MKKLINTLMILSLFIFTKNVNALTFNDNNIVTNNNVTITNEEYEKLKEITSDINIDNLPPNILKTLISSTAKKSSDKIYIVTITEYINNIVINENSVITTKENAIKAAKEQKLYVDNDGKIKNSNLKIATLSSNSYYSTTSKEVSIDYYIDNNNDYVIHLVANWFSLPKIRVFGQMDK